MSLLITIIKSPGSVLNTESSKTFDANGGSIGRGNDNAWILEDPDRFLSSRHCQLSCENTQFYITDLSTNGTFYNGSPHPMGKGTKLPVNHGDTFSLGDYEFSMSVSSAESLSDPFAGNVMSSAPIADDLFAAPSSAGNNDFGDDIFSSGALSGGHVSSTESLFPMGTEETDPLAALDKAQGGAAGGMNPLGSSPDSFTSNADPFGASTQPDQADALNQQISWPNAVAESAPNTGGIPDDWEDDLMASSPVESAPVVPQPPQAIPAQAIPPQAIPPQAVPQQAPVSALQDVSNIAVQNALAENKVLAAETLALKKANAILHAELKVLKQQMEAQQQRGTTADITVDTTLIDAMGFQDHQLVDAQITQINELVGGIVREMIAGLMQVLSSRSSIKNEFRMNVTTIQPVENNPLKFSANVDDALENMFIKKGNAYKKPLEAVREGFDGIAEHQVAILAGIRAAFKGVVERFDPILLDARFSRQNKGGLLPGSQRAKNWDMYLDYYSELVGDLDNTFQYLFGDDFVQAYEDQLQKLAIARKSKNSKKENK